MDTTTARLTFVWAALCVLTLASGSFAPAHTEVTVSSSVPITVTVLAIALIKARMIIRHFMEVRTAPAWLRLATDGWLAALWGAVLALYLY
jgi:hypothetical protein